MYLTVIGIFITEASQRNAGRQGDRMANLRVCYRGGNSEGETGYWLGFDYDPKFVEEFKQLIPHTHRRWDSENKVWWVSIEYDSTLQNLFPNYYALVHQQGSFF